MFFVLWILLSGFGVGVCLHRLLAHKSFETTVEMRNILSTIACFCIQGSPIFWVNVHRGYHHRYADTDRDIHTPKKGALWAYMLWPNFVDYTKLNYRSITDLAREDWQHFLNEYYFKIIWFGWVFALIMGRDIFLTLVAAQLITMHLEFCVNLFCHKRNFLAYRNFDTKDDSVNYWLFGTLCWGIGFHNNHHANPSSYDFGVKKYELDLTKYLVRLVRKNV